MGREPIGKHNGMIRLGYKSDVIYKFAVEKRDLEFAKKVIANIRLVD